MSQTPPSFGFFRSAPAELFGFSRTIRVSPNCSAFSESFGFSRTIRVSPNCSAFSEQSLDSAHVPRTRAEALRGG
jgi:uncharacterized protein (DUF2141 family)